MRSLEGGDRMEEILVRRIEIPATAMVLEDYKDPPSPVERETLDGKGQISSKEALEDGMHFFIWKLFAEDDVSRRINNLPPQSLDSVSPNLPLVLYNNPNKFLSNFIKIIRVYSVHVNYKASTSSGGNSSSNVGLQGSLQPRSQGCVLLAWTQ